MPAFTFFHEFKRYLCDGTIDLDGHTFKALLTNTAPDAAANMVKADITEIGAGNGYAAGGATLASVTWTETGAGTGIWAWDSDDFGWNASGGNIGPFRYIVIYDDTVVSDPLVGFYDYGAAVTLTDGNPFNMQVSTNGHFRF